MNSLTTELLSQACRIFFNLAYPAGKQTIPEKKRAYLDITPDMPLTAFLPPLDDHPIDDNRPSERRAAGRPATPRERTPRRWRSRRGADAPETPPPAAGSTAEAGKAAVRKVG